MTALLRADVTAPARRLAGARVAADALREYPLRVQALELQFAGFAGQMAEFGGRLSSLEGRMDRVEQRLDRIEILLEQVVAELKRLTIDVAEMKGRLSQMPTNFQLVSWGLSLCFGISIGMSGLIYAVVRATLAH